MAQAERIWRIQHLLRDGVIVPKRVFLEELGISPAQFKRDLSFLRDRFQVEIDYDRERRGYAVGSRRLMPKSHCPVHSTRQRKSKRC
jgi:predicted DNA-binding transcriptional regulator YafY